MDFLYIIQDLQICYSYSRFLAQITFSLYLYHRWYLCYLHDGWSSCLLSWQASLFSGILTAPEIISVQMTHNQTSRRFLRNKVWEELSWSKHLYKTESFTYSIIFCHKSRNRMTFMKPIDLKAKGIVKYEKRNESIPLLPKPAREISTKLSNKRKSWFQSIPSRITTLAMKASAELCRRQL